MLIDDELPHLLITERYLARAGSNRPIKTFRDGEQAVAFLRTAIRDPAQRPGLIICDIQMPGLNGLQVLGWVKQHPELARLPFVVLTSSEDPADVARAQELKADAYLVKFPKVERFAEILTQLLGDS